MNPRDIPDNVLSFIDGAIDSVPELEALLLLRQDEPRLWSEVDLSARIYISREEARRVLETLCRRDMFVVEGDPPRFRFSPAKAGARELVAEVASAYQRHLTSIAILIHKKSSASVREFARAFDLKKGR